MTSTFTTKSGDFLTSISDINNQFTYGLDLTPSTKILVVSSSCPIGIYDHVLMKDSFYILKIGNSNPAHGKEKFLKQFLNSFLRKEHQNQKTNHFVPKKSRNLFTLTWKPFITDKKKKTKENYSRKCWRLQNVTMLKIN